MKNPFTIKQLRFYLWVGLAYLLLWELIVLVDEPETFSGRSVNELWRAIYLLFVNYLFFEYTLPAIRFTRNRIILSLLLIIGQWFLYSFGLYGWRYIGIQLSIFTVYREFGTLSEVITYHFSAGVTSLFFYGVIKHIYDFIQLRKSAQQLRIEKQQAELNYLKSQTNPHFLFNTLNNIYSLARDKSDLAPESILRLSKILRFMLYETSGDYIHIEQEIKIMDDYIALEKLRYDETLQINFTHDIEDMKQPLPPLLLIPLVENAFKHGVSETMNRPFVDIRLSLRQQILEFYVKNSTDKFADDLNIYEKIGLSNLRRQLELLYRDYHLSVVHEQSEFSAVLKINLASHV